MAVHVEHKQTMLILQHEKNFMDDYGHTIQMYIVERGRNKDKRQ